MLLLSILGHLLLEAKSAILIRVEEANEAVALTLGDTEAALVAEEVGELEGADIGIAVSVQPLESGVGCEVADVAEALAGCLKTSLAVTDSDKKLLQSTLRLKSKAHGFSIHKNTDKAVSIST